MVVQNASIIHVANWQENGDYEKGQPADYKSASYNGQRLGCLSLPLGISSLLVFPLPGRRLWSSGLIAGAQVDSRRIPLQAVPKRTFLRWSIGRAYIGEGCCSCCCRGLWDSRERSSNHSHHCCRDTSVTSGCTCCAQSWNTKLIVSEC